jgi:hypothetical protein
LGLCKKPLLFIWRLALPNYILLDRHLDQFREAKLVKMAIQKILFCRRRWQNTFYTTPKYSLEAPAAKE